MPLMRGKFQLFACQSGMDYAQALVKELNVVITKRAGELRDKKALGVHERNELEFIDYWGIRGTRLGQANILAFDDGEMDIMIDPKENVRDKDVFLIQNHYNTTNGLSVSENVMETLIFVDALRRAKARTITLVTLYFPYARGDKQHGKDGVPAKLFANLLETAGVDNLITMDLHADQIIGFFNPSEVRVEHLHASPLLYHFLKDNMEEQGKITAPDVGAAKRAQRLAKALNKSLLMAYKRRSYEKKHTVDELKLLGLPSEEEAIIVDDIVASGGSVISVIDLLKEKGVKKVSVACTHAMLVGKAVEKFDAMYKDKNNPFKRIITTDSIPHNGELKGKPWYVEINTTRYLARALYEVHTSGSLTPIHEYGAVEKYDLWVKDK